MILVILVCGISHLNPSTHHETCITIDFIVCISLVSKMHAQNTLYNESNTLNEALHGRIIYQELYHKKNNIHFPFAFICVTQGPLPYGIRN